MSSCASISLSSFVQQYMAEGQIANKKYFGSYLITAKWAFKKLFRNTLYSVQSNWFPVKNGDPYNYIEIPKGIVRWFSVGVEDSCGLIQPLYYNSQLNIIKKPTSSRCTCDQCSCEGGCNDFEDMTVTTKEVFIIAGVPYYERTWIKVCKNGDILEYKEQPVKKYNDYIGSMGDYNEDYNEDYDVNDPGFDNFTIETITSQRKLCALDVRPCGCPEATPDNLKKIHECCGCYLKPGSFYLRKCCTVFKENINDNGFGEVKISECGTRIYFNPAKCGPTSVTNPQYLQLNYQTNGDTPGAEIQVPELAYYALSAGVFYRVTERNGKYGLSERQEAERRMEKEENLLLRDLNPVSLQFLSNLQDANIRW